MKYIVCAGFMLCLLVISSISSVKAEELIYDYYVFPEYFDETTIPSGEIVIGETGQVRPNQASILKDFQYAFHYVVSDPSILSIDKTGRWKALKEGEVRLSVYGRREYNESPEFEAELDKFGFKRKLSPIGTTDIQYNVQNTIKVVGKNHNVSPVYRLYQPDLKVHLYTMDENEYRVLGTRGWHQEGQAWTSNNASGTPVYRLYHPGLKVHLYTMDTNEYKVLATRGWNQEGEAYKSSGNTPVYRLYHAGIKKHLYTRDVNEKNVLSTRGWKYEGVAWNVE
ncbi:hypothetical protein BU202_09275 [Streptococcus cuniculi]|uniref:DUF5648 domain-containing protein n=1 Tax=Streptococcus cuniculi TaxID=1432788 RepID=A0A1Q8E5T1_9STRE|nr:hypothetical protein BU202_09275 [Streptococcus cuniculi]